tara:strand:- start:64 stop:1131 length:1068 start_codon:yes stop_codon:yes gene_type:complete
MKPINVLSLFDGMSCGQIALDRLGVPVNKYYASEIDKHAIKVCKKNYPKTIHVGDVTALDPKDYTDISLILAGSPCQGFSMAGKKLAFDDPRSALFFEFIRLLKGIKPKYFLLENVSMSQVHLDIISEQVSAVYPEHKEDGDFFGGAIKPHFFNSSKVSAQSRDRYYWTNIKGIKEPKDRGIVITDILETNKDKQNIVKSNDKFNKPKKLDTEVGTQQILEFIKSERTKDITPDELEDCVIPYDSKSIKIIKNLKEGEIAATHIGHSETFGNSVSRSGKAYTVIAKRANGIIQREKQLKYRSFTPVEVERLQTVPDNYTSCVSRAQRIKMLGNGWTVEMICHILSYMDFSNDNRL